VRDKIVVLLVELLSSEWRVFQLYLIVDQLKCLDGSTPNKYNEVLLFVEENSVVLLSSRIHLRFLGLVWFVEFINNIAYELVLLEVPLHDTVFGFVGECYQHLRIRALCTVES
jgi:hypothetical protein